MILETEFNIFDEVYIVFGGNIKKVEILAVFSAYKQGESPFTQYEVKMPMNGGITKPTISEKRVFPSAASAASYWLCKQGLTVNEQDILSMEVL